MSWHLKIVTSKTWDFVLFIFILNSVRAPVQIPTEAREGSDNLEVELQAVESLLTRALGIHRASPLQKISHCFSVLQTLLMRTSIADL